MNHEKGNNHGMSQMVVMALACTVPLAIIVVLSFFGISSKWITIGAIGLMVFLHVLMMKDHFSGNYKNKGGRK